MAKSPAIERVVIFGGRGAGVIVAFTLLRIAEMTGTKQAIGFLNDVEPAGALVGGLPVLGRFADWRLCDPDVRFIAPLHAYDAMPARLGRIEELGVPDDRWASPTIDPAAIVAPDAILGPGVVIGAGAQVLPGARLGRHVFVRNAALVSHDVTIGDFVQVGAGAVLNGHVVAESGAYIGPQSVVRDRTRVGRFAQIGMGAVVSKDVDDGKSVVGGRVLSARPAVDEQKA